MITTLLTSFREHNNIVQVYNAKLQFQSEPLRQLHNAETNQPIAGIEEYNDQEEDVTID